MRLEAAGFAPGMVPAMTPRHRRRRMRRVHRWACEAGKSESAGANLGRKEDGKNLSEYPADRYESYLLGGQGIIDALLWAGKELSSEPTTRGSPEGRRREPTG